MRSKLRGKDFITLRDWTKEEIDTLLEVSFELKEKFLKGEPTPYLPYKTIFLMFLNNLQEPETLWKQE